MSPSVGEADSKTAVFAWIEHEQAPSVKAAVESARPDEETAEKMRVPGNPNAGDFFALRVRRSRRERRTYARDGRLNVALDQGRVQPEHAGAREHRVTARISASLLVVVPAIDPDHEPPSGRQEVSNAAPEQRHLATEHHAESAAANAVPTAWVTRACRERARPGAQTARDFDCETRACCPFESCPPMARAPWQPPRRIALAPTGLARRLHPLAGLEPTTSPSHRGLRSRSR